MALEPSRDRPRYPTRRVLPHGTPPERRAPSTYLLTICSQPRGRNQLCREEIASQIRTSLEFHHERGTWCLHVCVLMPDHLHLLLSATAETRLTHTVTYWKRYVARQCGVAWQRDFFEHRLRHDEHFDAKVDYLRMNPVRGGLVDTPERWPYLWEWPPR